MEKESEEEKSGEKDTKNNKEKEKQNKERKCESENDDDEEDGDKDDEIVEEEDDDTPKIVKIIPGTKKTPNEDNDDHEDVDEDNNKKEGQAKEKTDTDAEMKESDKQKDKPTKDKKTTKGNGTKPSNGTANDDAPIKRTEGLIKRYYATLPDKAIQRKFVRRYDLKVWVKPSTEGNIVLAEQLRKWFKKVKDFDKTAMLVTYRKEDKFWYCLNPESIPESVSRMKELFQGANPRPKGGGIYVQCILAHNKPFKTIMKEISWSFSDDKMGMWERHCQSEQTIEIGWLVYLLRDMDIEDLCNEFEKWFGAAVGFRWRAIKVTAGSTWNPNRAEADTPKALHLVLNKQDVARVKPLIKKTYSHGSNDFPLGIKMRFIPCYADLIGAHARAKMQQVAARQASFCAHMKGATTWEILSLDNEDSQAGQTLREVIMSLKSKKIPNLPVFHCISPGWKNDGSIRFYFIPQLADEAQTTIAGLLPILRYFYGDWVQKSFTVSAIERHQHHDSSQYEYYQAGPNI